MEIAVRCFKPELMPLMAEENRLSSEYQKLYASAMVEFDGKTMPLPKLGPYKQSTDRAVRKAAYETEGRFFDEHQQELDELYDKLVKNRTEQARMLGYENYLPLGYDRMGRNCYGPGKVAAFRDQVVADLVPLVQKRKEAQRSRLGLEHLYFYDDVMLFPDGNATPQGTAEDILKAGLDMYHGLSAETAEFIDFMYENELLDVLSKDGKAPGGYCTSIPLYQAPFIFSNFNGTAGDVDVMTHEAGHAFNAFLIADNKFALEIGCGGMETAETHSMSMEYFAWKYIHKFFGEDARKYKYMHALENFSFIPYGTMVDAFQHIVYENPEMTPAQRNEAWLELERKFRPHIQTEGVPFIEEGRRWQYQMHIYESPFYYIDYCLAQTVALQFWAMLREDREAAWKTYMDYTRLGGSMVFTDLLSSAGLRSPFDPECLKEIAAKAKAYLDNFDLTGIE
jgi:M3 family oligoendopeptidase